MARTLGHGTRAALGATLLAVMVAFAGALAGCESGVKITSISPDVGTIAGGEDVILNGSGFKTGLQVKFGGAEAKNVVIMGSNQIKANTPANHKGPCDVTVTFDDGRAFKIANAFRYADPSELMKRDMLGKSGKAPEGKAEGKAEPKK